MLGSVILDVAIGLVLVFCLYSLLATTIKEIIASMLSLRAKKLERAIKQMLDDPILAGQIINKFFNHPLISHLNDGGKFLKKPSYIAAEHFSKVLIDILKTSGGISGAANIDLLTSALKKIDSNSQSDTVRLIESFLIEANDKIDTFKTSIEQWFDTMMEHTTGWYKRQSQWIIFIIGFIIAMLFNVNTFEIVNHLSKDKSAREQMVQLAVNYSKIHSVDVPDSLSLRLLSANTQRLDSLVLYADSLCKADIRESNRLLGMGWNSVCDFTDHISIRNIFGWVITALAISLGAPFWYDLLNKLVQLRGTGPKPEKNNKKN